MGRREVIRMFKHILVWKGWWRCPDKIRKNISKKYWKEFEAKPMTRPVSVIQSFMMLQSYISHLGQRREDVVKIPCVHIRPP